MLTVRVRHSTFREETGKALTTITKHDRLGNESYPACVVVWDNPRSHLDQVMANYNLVFIVPAPIRRVTHD